MGFGRGLLGAFRFICSKIAFASKGAAFAAAGGEADLLDSAGGAVDLGSAAGVASLGAGIAGFASGAGTGAASFEPASSAAGFASGAGVGGTTPAPGAEEGLAPAGGEADVDEGSVDAATTFLRGHLRIRVFMLSRTALGSTGSAVAGVLAAAGGEADVGADDDRVGAGFGGVWVGAAGVGEAVDCGGDVACTMDACVADVVADCAIIVRMRSSAAAFESDALFAIFELTHRAKQTNVSACAGRWKELRTQRRGGGRLRRLAGKARHWPGTSAGLSAIKTLCQPPVTS